MSWFASCARRAWPASLVLALGCSKPATPREQADRRCDEAVADGAVTEARAWLADPAHEPFDMPLDEMRDVAERLYSAGAPRVLAAWNQVGSAQKCALYVVELPPPGPKRDFVFSAYQQLTTAEAEADFQPDRDVGQRCVLVPLE